MFVGILFILANNLDEEFKLNLRQTFLFSTTLAWVMVALFGSLPFLLSPTQTYF